MAKSKERKVGRVLQESGERFRLMADSIQDGITIIEEGQAVYVNERLSEILGYSRDELMRIEGVELAAPEERERLQTLLQAARKEGRLLEELEYWAVRKDGSRCYVRNRYSTSDEPDGVQRRFVVTSDITEQKQAERELQKSEERFRDVALSTSDWVWEVDGQARYTYCSERVVDALGYTAEEILGKTPFDLMPPDEAARVGEIFGEIVANKQPVVDLENVNIRKDGRSVHLLTNGVPILDEAGNLAGYRGVDKDITEQKQLEERQARMASLYSQFSELQTELLAPAPLEDKLKQVTDWTVDYMGADFARIWVIEQGDLCEDCMHAQVMEGDRHICLDKERCLHLRSSSGRYTHIDGEVHRRVPFGAYKIGRVAGGVDTKFLTNDVPNDPRVHNLDWARELGLISFAGYKLATPEEGVLGVFALFSQQTISPEEDALLESIASAISLAIRASALEEERAKMAEARAQELHEIAQRRAEEVRLSTEVAQEVAGAPALDELYSRVVTLVKERFGYYHAQIFRHDPEADAMVVVEGYGEAGAKMKAAGHSLPYGTGVVGTAAASGEPVLAADVTEDPNWVPHPELPETKGELAVPIKLRDEVLGVLDVQSDEAGALSEEDQILLLGLAGQIAVAIQNTNLLEQSQAMLVEVQQSEELLRTIIDATPDWIFIKDQEHRYRLANQGYADALHIAPEDFIGKNDLELGFPEELVKGDPEKGIRGFWADDRLVMDSGERQIYPRDPATIDGQLHVFHTIKTPLRDAQGNVWGVLAFARDMTDREQLLADVQQSETLLSVRVQELDCLNDIGRKIEEVPPVPEFLTWVAERIPAAMECSDVCVAAIEFNGQVYGAPEAIDQPCQMASGLRVGDQAVGKVYISYTEEHEFLDEESALLGDIVRRVSAYIENRRLTEQTEAALDETTILYRASQAINTATTMDEVLHALTDAMDMPGLVRADIALFDRPWTKDDKPEYMKTAAAWDKRLEEDENAEPTSTVGARFELEMFPASRFLKPDEPLVYADVETDPRIDEATLHLFLNVFQARSALFLPLVAGGQWIGFFGPFMDHAIEFDETYLRRLMTLTGQTAVVVQSLLRLQEVQDALTQTETLYAGSEKVVRSANIDGVLQALVESTALQQLDRVGIVFFDRPWEDEQPEEVVVVAAWERGGVEPREPVGTRYAFSQFPVIDTITADSPVILRDITADERVTKALRTALVDRLGMCSMGLWPLVVGGQWIGMLVGESGAVMEIEENEERQIASLVDQAATVIQTQRLFEQTEVALTQTEMLYNASRALIAAENPREMLQTIAQPAIESGAESASLMYVEVDVEGQPEWAEVMTSIGETALEGIRLYLPEVPQARLLLDNPDRPLLIADVDALDKMADEQIIQMMKSSGTRATAVLPLRVGQSWQGMASISWPEPHEFSSKEEQLFGLIGPQLASRILGLRLRDEAEHRALWLQTAAEVSHAASTILEPNRLMQQVVDLVRDRFDLYYAGLFLVGRAEQAPGDDETDEAGDAAGRGWAILRVGTGEAGRQMVENGHKLEIGGQSMIGQCLATRLPRVAMDVGQEAVRFENPLLPDTRTELALPLVSRGQPLGALTIQSVQTAAFSEEDISVLQTMTDQLAITIDNVNLIEQAQSRAEREQRVRTITDRIRRGADAETIMRVTLEELSRMLGTSKAVMRLGTQAQLGGEPDDGSGPE